MLAPSKPSTLELINRFHRLCELTAASSDPDGCVTTSFQCGIDALARRVSVLVVVADAAAAAALRSPAGPGVITIDIGRDSVISVIEKRAVPAGGGPC